MQLIMFLNDNYSILGIAVSKKNNVKTLNIIFLSKWLQNVNFRITSIAENERHWKCRFDLLWPLSESVSKDAVLKLYVIQNIYTHCTFSLSCTLPACRTHNENQNITWICN